MIREIFNAGSAIFNPNTNSKPYAQPVKATAKAALPDAFIKTPAFSLIPETYTQKDISATKETENTQDKYFGMSEEEYMHYFTYSSKDGKPFEVFPIINAAPEIQKAWIDTVDYVSANLIQGHDYGPLFDLYHSMAVACGFFPGDAVKTDKGLDFTSLDADVKAEIARINSLDDTYTTAEIKAAKELGLGLIAKDFKNTARSMQNLWEIFRGFYEKNANNKI